MTSDAKIGLLLGLVFIFVIAFLINGLPSFTQAGDNNELTTNMVTSPNTDDIGITGSNRQLTEREVTRRTRTPSQPRQETAQQPSSPQEQTSSNFTSEPEGAITERDKAEKEVRFERKLPGGSSSEVSKSPNKTDVSMVADSGDQSDDDNNSSENKLPTEYVVQKGDTLASIAKKFYGEKAGNKLENINLIFDGNGGKLDTRDEIYVGQVLRIPPLPSEEEQDSESKSIGDTISEKIRSVGEKLTRKSEKKRYYTVEEGDSLWKIAYKCLGDGSRYKEILKLNSDKLKSEDHVTVGMKLLIPSE